MLPRKRYRAFLNSFRLVTAVMAVSVLAGVAAAQDYVWHFVSPQPTGNPVRRVEFLNGQFFAGGNAGTLLTSSDGQSWTDQTLPATYNIVAMAYGGGRYVASDERTGVYSSTDGAHWVVVRQPVYYYWAGGRQTWLAYGNGIFVRLMTLTAATPTNADLSTDGVTWQQIDALPFMSAQSLVFGQGRFVATSSGAVWSSVEGRTWTKVAEGSADSRCPLAFGNGAFVVVRAAAGCLRSTDGLAWSAAEGGPTLTDVSFLNGWFYGRTAADGAILRSADGLTWSAFAPAGDAGYLLRAAFGNGVFVAIDKPDGGALLRSTDAATWTPVNKIVEPAPAPGAPIVFGNQVFISPGVRSVDGVHWSTETFVRAGSAENPTRMYFVGDRFIVYQDHAWYVSTDGREGRKAFTPTDPAEIFGPPLYALGKFIIPAAQGALVSTDGEAWTRDAALAGLFGATAYGDGVFVRSRDGRLESSPDGSVWTTRYVSPNSEPPILDPHYTLGSPLYGNGRFLVPGQQMNSHGHIADYLLTSPDGVTWTTVTPSPHGIVGLTFANGLFVCQSLPEFEGRASPHATFALASPQFHVSLDGGAWFSSPMPTDKPVTSFAGNDQVFLASSEAGLLATTFPTPSAPLAGALTVTGTTVLKRGATVRLTSAPAGTPPFTYEWRRNGQTITDATAASYTAGAGGSYQVIVSNAAGWSVSSVVVVAMDDSWLANVSSRAHVGTGEDVLIQGFVVRGPTSLLVVARGIGPSLAAYGVSDPLPDPALKLYTADGSLYAENDNWSERFESDLRRAFNQVGAFSLASGSKDAATTTNLLPGSHTFHVQSVTGAPGVALSELYDTGGVDRIVNLSARARVAAGDRTLIAGFVIGGGKPLKVLLRGVGPALAAYGVAHPLANPKLTLFNAAGREIHNNDNWSDARNVAEIRAATTATGAFTLADGTYDAAMVESLEPGVYTAHVTAADGTSSGVALVEIYAVPE